MLEPEELLAAAETVASPTSLDPSDAQLRRATSTAYYALFHSVIRAASDHFIGAGCRDSAGYALIYRSFSHSRMKQICLEIDKPKLAKQYRQALACASVSQDMRLFAFLFAALQELRHEADYNPRFLILRADAIVAINYARTAIAHFNNTEPAERTDVMTLMLVGARP